MHSGGQFDKTIQRWLLGWITGFPNCGHFPEIIATWWCFHFPTGAIFRHKMSISVNSNKGIWQPPPRKKEKRKEDGTLWISGQIEVTNLLPETDTPLSLWRSLSFASNTGTGSRSCPLNLPLRLVSLLMSWEGQSNTKPCWGSLALQQYKTHNKHILRCYS